MAAALLLIGALWHPTAWAATAESKYYVAESCAQKLRDNPQQQKYRDRWIGCIQKYLAVYREDPRGPWAAAGLYRAGAMYGDLYKLNKREGDRREALDLLDNVVKNYPQSRYKEQARQAADRLNGGRSAVPAVEAPKQKMDAKAPQPMETKKTSQPAAAASSTQQWYDIAQRQERRLAEDPKLQKMRDQWFKAIHAYRQVLQTEPGGPLTPAALYGMGSCYAGMYKWSRSSMDHLQSQKAFEELIKVYPESLYADKARTELGPAASPSAQSDGDAITQVISSAQMETAPTLSNARTASAQQPAMVEGLRFWSNPRYTRVVIDANADTTFSYRELREDLRLGKPQRIYIDVHNSRLGQDLQKVVPINDNLLSDARAGQYTNDTVRVVVDTKSSQTFKIFSLKNPYRIVLDVWGVENGVGVVAAKPVPQDARREKPEPASKKIPPSAIVKQLALGVRRIVIDPGHGGKDYGAPGAIKGVHEKHVVLEIGQRLARKIRTDLQCEVVMTRNSDTYLSLEERTAIANTQNADLFISIHTNASLNSQAYGIETFILNLATDDEAIRVAARENATSAKNISDLDSILHDLMHNAKVNESTRLASYVQQDVMRQLRKRYDPLRDKGVKKAPFYVLLGAQMPSILVETAFISNARECKWLMTDDYQERLCQGIVAAIRRYIEDTNPMALQKSSNAGNKG